MKKGLLHLFVFLGCATPAFAQGSIADAFIRGAEAGASFRQSEALRDFYARQAKLADAQARLVEAQIRRLEDAEARARAAMAQKQDASAPEVQAAAAAQAQAVLEVFTLIHPDWKQREAEMLAFGRKVAPTTDTSPIEYLEILYTLAKAKTVP